MDRQQAIEIIRKEYLCVSRDCDIERSCGKCDLMMPSKEPILEAYKMAMDALAIPSAEPKPGQWILLDECSNSGYYCSECHKKVVKEGWSNTVKKIKYCPNCGARMVEPQESEVEE